MNVTIIADVLGAENNGTTIACMNLVRYLRDRGDTVKIVCCDQDKKNEPGYYVVPTLNLGPIINYMVKKNCVTLAKPDRSIIESAIEGSDIVHCMIPFALSKKTLKICREKGIPVTAGFHMQAENFSSHLALMNCGIANYFIYQNIYRTFYKNVDAIHYPTKFIQKVFESVIEERTNGYVISNGVNDRFQYKKVGKPEELKDKFVILSTGRFSKEKAQKVLVKAVGYSKYKDKIQLLLAGEGPKVDSAFGWLGDLFGDIGNWFKDTFNIGGGSNSTSNNTTNNNVSNQITINTSSSTVDIDSLNNALAYFFDFNAMTLGFALTPIFTVLVMFLYLIISKKKGAPLFLSKTDVNELHYDLYLNNENISELKEKLLNSLINEKVNLNITDEMTSVMVDKLNEILLNNNKKVIAEVTVLIKEESVRLIIQDNGKVYNNVDNLKEGSYINERDLAVSFNRNTFSWNK